MGFLLSPLLWKVIGIAVLAALLAYAVHEALDHFRDEGRKEQLAKDQPVIDELRADVTTLKANQATLEGTIERQNAAVRTWQDEATASRAQAVAALARAASVAKAYQSQIDALTAIADGPHATDFATACKEANALMARLMDTSDP